MQAFAALRAHGLSLPGAWEDFPWGHCALKVKKKVFAFLVHGNMKDSEDDGVGVSVKLPQSAGQALSLPFAKPTGYGLGKSNWVSLSFGAGDDVPVDILLPWITESFDAIAPKSLLNERLTTTAKLTTKKTAATKTATKTKKTAAKKTATKTKKTKTAMKKTAKKKTKKK